MSESAITNTNRDECGIVWSYLKRMQLEWPGIVHLMVMDEYLENDKIVWP